MSYFKSRLSLYGLRKLTFYIFEFIFEGEVDSEADFACNRVMGEFSREKYL